MPLIFFFQNSFTNLFNLILFLSDMLILKHLVDILSYDFSLGGHYFKNYVRKWGFITKSEVEKSWYGPGLKKFKKLMNIF